MAELSVAKSPSNLNLSEQQIYLLQLSLPIVNKITDILRPHMPFILPNAAQLLFQSKLMLDFAHT